MAEILHDITMLSWNIKSGGFGSYDPNAAHPVRGTVINEYLMRQRIDHDVSAVTLLDAYRWDEVYGGEQGIARHLGYAAARFIRLGDPRLDAGNGAGIGIAFAANHPIQESNPMDLGERQGLRAILDVGKYGLQVASVYADDLSEDKRKRQINALLAGLEPDVPTVLVGDFNILRPNMRGASSSTKLRNMGVHIMAKLLPQGELGTTVREMNRREAYPLLAEADFQDADPYQRPTALGRLKCFGVDYAFHNSSVQIDNFEVLPIRGESDHNPIRFRARLAV
jgi:endonuclease/exonuclease/phosphatase family metal-dependent hydrolase